MSPVGISIVFQRVLTVPLHSHNDRQMPVIRAVHRLWKSLPQCQRLAAAIKSSHSYIEQWTPNLGHKISHNSNHIWNKKNLKITSWHMQNDIYVGNDM